MAPKKSPPYSFSKIRNLTGITFSLELIPSAVDDVLEIEKHHRYQLQPNVHTISSLSLVRRLNQHKAKEMLLQPKLVKSKARRRKTSSTAVSGECIWCGTHKTAQWRKVSLF
jgi:hypothetical protein